VQKKNVLSQLSPELFNFMEVAPMIVIEPENVKNIKENEFEAIKDLLTAEMESLRQNNEALQIRFQEQQALLQETLEEQREEQARLQTEYRDMVRNYSEQMNQLRNEQENRIAQMIEAQNQQRLIDSQNYQKKFRCTITSKRNRFPKTYKRIRNTQRGTESQSESPTSQSRSSWWLFK